MLLLLNSFTYYIEEGHYDVSLIQEPRISTGNQDLKFVKVACILYILSEMKKF